jgi:hypothetical protein
MGQFAHTLRLLKAQAAAMLLMLSMLLAMSAPDAQAAPRTTNLNIVPVIQSITVQNGQLVATGVATAIIKGKTYQVPFTAPVDISLAADQTGADPGCPILDLALGPIDLNLLGLRVLTSPICLKVTAHEGGGLLGDLLCAVSNLLNGGLSLNQILAGQGLVDPFGVVILPGLTGNQITGLLNGLTSLLNGALQQLYQAVLTAIDHIDAHHVCSILHLELGPLELNLLGLVVELDDCDNGPVTVDITAITGPGNLLGNLLCSIVNLLNPGLSLGDLLNLLLGLLTS